MNLWKTLEENNFKNIPRSHRKELLELYLILKCLPYILKTLYLYLEKHLQGCF
jgi:hypothetical protein